METTIAFVPRETVSRTMPALTELLKKIPQGCQFIAVVAGYPQHIKDEVTLCLNEIEGEIIDHPTYLTPNEARNMALARAKGKYIVFVDNDVTVAENWLQSLVECARETGSAIVGPLTFEGWPQFQRIHMAGGEADAPSLDNGLHDYREFHYHPHRNLDEITEPIERTKTGLAEFHTVLVETDWLKSRSGLDPHLLSISEHWDMCLSAIQEGRSIFLEPRSQVTYSPPLVFTAEDIRFFNLRWSDEWGQYSIRRLQQKYAIDPASLKGIARFLTQYRRHRFTPMRNRIKKVIGGKFGSLVYRIFRYILLSPDYFKCQKDLKRWKKFSPTLG